MRTDLARLGNHDAVDSLATARDLTVSHADTLTLTLSGGKKTLLRLYGWPACLGLAYVSIWLMAAPPKGPGNPLLGVLAFAGFNLVLAIAVLWFVERRVSVRVVAQPDALIVRNSLKTYRIPWSDIAGYGDARARALKDVRLRDGRRITMQGVDPGWFGNSAPQEQKLARLRLYRESAASSESRHVASGEDAPGPDGCV